MLATRNQNYLLGLTFDINQWQPIIYAWSYSYMNLRSIPMSISSTRYFVKNISQQLLLKSWVPLKSNKWLELISETSLDFLDLHLTHKLTICDDNLYIRNLNLIISHHLPLYWERSFIMLFDIFLYVLLFDYVLIFWHYQAYKKLFILHPVWFPCWMLIEN